MTVEELHGLVKKALIKSSKVSMIVYDGKEHTRRNVKTVHIRRDGSVEFRDTGHCFDGYVDGLICWCQD